VSSALLLDHLALLGDQPSGEHLLVERRRAGDVDGRRRELQHLKPACCSRAAALRIRSASEVKLTATSWVISDCASNSDIPPIERGDACA
jgi:hypothetical protein